MLIYCAQLSLVPTSLPNDLLETCANWLRLKTREDITAVDLVGEGERRPKDGSRVEWLSASHDHAAWYAVRYTHPDRKTEGRTWLTEIGIYRAADRLLCSVLLRTEERSALVDPHVQTTRPKLVADIVERCRVSSDTCGGTARSLRLEDAEAFLYEVNNPGRRHPIVQVSPTLEGKYLMLPDRAATQLAGIATVAVIAPDVDTYALEEVVSPRFSCYHGAVNVIWPRVGSADTAFVPFQRIMAHEIEAVRARGVFPEHHLLAMLCHRLNETYARDHITPEMVRSVKHRGALDEARKTATTPDPEFAELARVVDEDQRRDIDSLRAQLKDRDAKIDELEGRLSDTANTIESLKGSLAASGTRGPGLPTSVLSEETRSALYRAMSKDAKLLDSLRTIALLFPERVIVLDSAWKSARHADAFNNPRKAFELLHTLCSQYWDALVSGKSDAEARAVLGTALSARESETVEKNRKARSLRTFTYKGKPIEMMMHLKIGVKDSTAETFRAHFEWDADDRRIVIGHCGKHLDHR